MASVVPVLDQYQPWVGVFRCFAVVDSFHTPPSDHSVVPFSRSSIHSATRMRVSTSSSEVLASLFTVTWVDRV